MTKQELMEKLEACGWLAEVPEQERKRIAKAIGHERYEEAPGARYEELAVVSYDTEALDTQGDSPGKDLDSYTKIVRYYGEQSWGAFDPQAIKEEWDEGAGTVTVSFEAKGQAFQTTVPMQSDWFQQGVHDLINQALEETGVAERFLLLPVLDQVAHYAFITPATMEKASEAGLFPSMAELIAEETGMDPDELAEQLGDL